MLDNLQIIKGFLLDCYEIDEKLDENQTRLYNLACKKLKLSYSKKYLGDLTPQEIEYLASDELDYSYMTKEDLLECKNSDNKFRYIELYLKKNPKQQLFKFDWIIENLGYDLTYLNLSNNNLKTIPNLDKLTSLTHLDLSNNKFEILPEGIFDNLPPSLTHLYLSHLSCDLLISKHAFDKLTSLTHLNLSGNHLIDLNEYPFDNLPLLTHLDLSHNTLEDLPTHIFDNLPSLKSLKFYGNYVIDFINFTYMKPSDLSDYKKSDNKMDFIKLYLLKNINQKVFSFSWIVENLGYEYVYCFDNKIERYPENWINEDTIKQMINLKKLTLTDIYFGEIPENFFDNFPKLEYLCLHHNEIQKNTKNVFDKLTSLKRLDLSDSWICLIDGLFDNLTSLTHLNLSKYEFESIPEHIFDKLQSLTRLNLSGNELKTIPNLDNLTSLTHLSLFGNKLEFLPKVSSICKIIS